jgi:phosphoribosylformylglycinamidine synthase
MGQFVGCVEGMAEACRALDFPVVSGNVSLYNETKNEDGSSLAILPTPAIGGVGLLEDWQKSATVAFKAEGEDIYLVGAPFCHLGQSLWLREVHGRREGPPPAVDLEAERRAGEWVRELIQGGRVTAVHDCSDGGLFVALAEMALSSGIGAFLKPPPALQYETRGPQSDTAWAFGEDQGRYVITVPRGSFNDIIVAPARLLRIGRTEGDSLRFAGMRDVRLADLRAAHEGFFPKLMGSELTPEF